MQGTAASRSWVFLIRHCPGGMVVGWTVVGGLLWLDVAGLGDLVITSDLFPMPLLMLLALFGITFGSVAVGSAIMGLGRCGDAAGETRSRLLPSGPPAAPRKIRSRSDPIRRQTDLSPVDEGCRRKKLGKGAGGPGSRCIDVRSRPAWLLRCSACYAARPVPSICAEAS